jgi:hypothetical protein
MQCLTFCVADVPLFFLYYLLLRMKSLQSFKMFGTTHQTAQPDIPEDWNPQLHCGESFKSHLQFCLWNWNNLLEVLMASFL